MSGKSIDSQSINRSFRLIMISCSGLCCVLFTTGLLLCIFLAYLPEHALIRSATCDVLGAEIGEITCHRDCYYDATLENNVCSEGICYVCDLTIRLGELNITVTKQSNPRIGSYYEDRSRAEENCVADGEIPCYYRTDDPSGTLSPNKLSVSAGPIAGIVLLTLGISIALGIGILGVYCFL